MSFPVFRMRRTSYANCMQSGGWRLCLYMHLVCNACTYMYVCKQRGCTTYRFHGLLEDSVNLAALPLELRLQERDVSVLLLLQRHQVGFVTAERQHIRCSQVSGGVQGRGKWVGGGVLGGRSEGGRGGGRW